MDIRKQKRIKAWIDYILQSLAAMALAVLRALSIVATGRVLASVV